MACLKGELHPRNRYDFSALTQCCPVLAEFIVRSPRGDETIDFASPPAVKALNQALLAHFYGVTYWDITDGFLCPPLPGSASTSVNVLDIGVGANCIYPLIGHYEYGWCFTGSDVNTLALKNAHTIIDANHLQSRIRLRRQKTPDAIFTGIIHARKRCEATLCNPPFHDSASSAQAGKVRKRCNLGLNDSRVLNFGGQQQELWCEGGEAAFITRMMRESQTCARQVLWFTSLVSRGDNLPALYRVLE